MKTLHSVELADKDPSHMTDDEVVRHLVELSIETGWQNGLGLLDDRWHESPRQKDWRRARVLLLTEKVMERLTRVADERIETEES